MISFHMVARGVGVFLLTTVSSAASSVLAQEFTARVVGDKAEAGRLEIFYNEEWSTVCDDEFGQEEAQVACRMLGFNSTRTAVVSSVKYGEGSGRILLDDLECKGTETSLAQCKHRGFYSHRCDHSMDVGVICDIDIWNITEQLAARLANSNQDGGRLEIFLNGEWGTVRQLRFGSREAQVACRMLGFNSNGAVAVSSKKYGRGSGRFLLQEVKCLGTETSLAQCNLGIFYPRYSNHLDDVGVICNISKQMKGRLTNGNPAAGRLEIFVNGEWGTVCDWGFGKEEAQVACRMLGFNKTGAAAAVSSEKYGEGSGLVLLVNVKCNGTETNLQQCELGLLYPHYCLHSMDVGVICNTTESLTARLVDGTAEEGRLEILFNGEWGTVCGTQFKNEEAQVVCRMLGINSTEAAAVSTAKYGQGSGRIMLDDVACNGTETNLEQCNGFFYPRLCDHSDDVGVKCETSMAEKMTARLVNGTSGAGRLEVSLKGKWGTVCEKGFEDKAALVACRMLGFNSTRAAVVSPHRYGQGSGLVLLQGLKCQGTETNLEQCKQQRFKVRGCNHSTDIGIICNITEQMKARLVNGTSKAGRLELFFNEEWNRVCQGRFAKKEAQVACRMLGFSDSAAAAVIYSNRYGEGSGQFLLNNVQCQGSETNLDQCQHEYLYPRECGISKDIELICNITEQMQARLTNGTREAGRLEIFFEGEWGTVCQDLFTKENAQVACRMLGFDSNRAGVVSSDVYGQGAGPTLFPYIQCDGAEASLAHCQHDGFYSFDCDHSRDVGVVCNITEEMTARLVNGTSEAGRLEIFYMGKWSTVCDLGHSNEEVQVACRMLGFNSTGSAVRSIIYGTGSGFRFESMTCQGGETSLQQCEAGLLMKECVLSVEIGVICDFKNFSLRLTGTGRTRVDMGRVEAESGHERFSRVCVSDDKVATVICRQLSLPSSKAVRVDGWSFGQRKRPLLEISFQCAGNENSIFDCNRTVAGHDCHSNDIAVFCSNDPSLYIVSVADAYPLMEGANKDLMCVTPHGYQRVAGYMWRQTAGGRPDGDRLIFDLLTRAYNGLPVRCSTSVYSHDVNYDLHSSVLLLQVYFKPSITIRQNNDSSKPLETSLSRFVVTQGENVTLWCEADSNPPPASITWSGRVNSTTGELRIIAAEHVTHSGLYTCTVVTHTVDDDDRLPLTSSYQLTLSVQE